MEDINYSVHYSKWHDDSNEHFDNSAEYYQYLLGQVIDHECDKNIHILDIGCGFGLAMYAFRKFGYTSIKGIDISPDQLEVARKKNLDVELVDNSVEWLTQNADKFDVITCFDVIEHLPVDLQLNFVRAINTALKDGGKFVCTVPNANSTFASRWRYIDWTHYTSFSEHSLEFVLLNSKFKEVDVRELDFRPQLLFPYIFSKSFVRLVLFKMVRGFRRLEALAELGMEGKDIPLSLNILAVAKK